ncbi:MAG: hypothetical protein AB1758_35095, partial [Candidatus Eremiobacterota bacterium]
MVPTEEGFEEVPIGTDPAAKSAQKEVLARYSPGTASDSLLRPASGSSQLFQRVTVSPALFGIHQLQGSSPPYQAYTPELLLMNGGHTHISPPPATFSPLPSGELVYRWTFPEAGRTLVLVGTTVGNVREFFSHNPGETQIDLVVRYTSHPGVTELGDPATILDTVTVLLRDVVVFEAQDLVLAGPRSPGQRIPFPTLPAFGSPVSGDYSISVTVDGELVRSETYRQSKLIFDRPFPEFDLNTLEPVLISNSFHWDNGLELEDPQWSVQVRDPRGLLVAQTGTRSGSEVAVHWDPQELMLARSDSEPARLVPATYGPVARGGSTYTYEVKISDVSYVGELDGEPFQVRYRNSGGGLATGRRRVSVANAGVSVTPFDPQVDSTTTFTASVVAVGFESEPDYHWKQSILPLEAEPGTPPLREFTGTTPDISVAWDGTDAAGAILPDGTYDVAIEAGACEPAGGGGSSGGGDDGAAGRHEEPGGICEVAIDTLNVVVESQSELEPMRMVFKSAQRFL